MPTDSTSLRRFTGAGLVAFGSFVLAHKQGEKAPPELMEDPKYSDDFGEGTLDTSKVFKSRFEFGEYLVERLAKNDFAQLMAPEADAFWAWVAAAYFEQLSAPTKRSPRPKKPEHFLVKRDGFKGSLHYRQGPRTCFEMVTVHGESARVCLSGVMGEFGDMTEQLTSRFNIARDIGYFRAASKLYLREYGLVVGASSRVKNRKRRKPGSRQGMAGAGRLALAFNRLSLTFDTTEMAADAILEVLPPEFNKFKS